MTNAAAPHDTNYYRYMAAAFNHHDHYPLDRWPDPTLYRPVASWIGRLILPDHAARRQGRGVVLEVHYAPESHRHLIGRAVDVRWSEHAAVQARVWAVTRDLHFSEQATKSSTTGLIHPTRLDHWRLTGPLESLAGGRPTDDVHVSLAEPVTVVADSEAANGIALVIDRDPVQITGRYYCLAQFVGPADDGGEAYQIRHYNRVTGQFDGADEIVRLPTVIENSESIAAFTNTGIEQSPLNALGWYLHGAQDAQGQFVVLAVVPRQLMQLRPERVEVDAAAAWKYVRHEAWKDAVARKGTITSVLCSPGSVTADAAIAAWKEGDRALLLHTYSGIGGKKREKMARSPLYVGHFSFGAAQVVREPLADELQFSIIYHQVYTTNVDGLLAGSLSWTRYMGDRQWGWAGSRPACDILLKLPAFTDDFDFDGELRSGLREFEANVAIMAARYRIGDGTGGTFVGAANNCAQDSAQALYATVKDFDEEVKNRPLVRDWMARHPEDAARLEELLTMAPALRRTIVGSRARRSDWRFQSANLGMSENPFKGLLRGLTTWRMFFPGSVSHAVAREFLRHGAAAWVLRTNQLGGNDPDIEPIPLTSPW